MTYAAKIVLHCPRGYDPRLEDMVRQFVRAGVKFIGVVGQDCSRIEDIVDDIVVGEGDDCGRFILTSSHEGETVEDAMEFAYLLGTEFEGEVQLIEI